MILINSVTGERTTVPPSRAEWVLRRISSLASQALYDPVSGEPLHRGSAAILSGDDVSNIDVHSLTCVATMERIVATHSKAHAMGGPFVPLSQPGYIYIPRLIDIKQAEDI